MPTPREASIWGRIRNDLSKAQQSILNGQYSEAMILDMSILKTLVRMQIDKAVLVSNNLESDIDQLFENQLISSETRDNYHTIRIYGEQAESGDTPTSQTANESYSLINEELSKFVDSNQTRPSIPSYSSSVQESEEPGEDSTESKDYSDDFTEEDTSDTDDFSESDVSRPKNSKISFIPDLGGVNIPLSNIASSRGQGRRGNERPVKPVRSTGRPVKSGGRRPAPGRVRVNRSVNDNSRPKKKQDFELDAYNILKFAIPIACVVLLIILIKIILGGSDKSTVETTAARRETVVESTAAVEAETPEETVSETEASSSIWVTTTGVKVRTEPNTDCQVLEVLDAGVQVTYKGDANDEWIIIDYDGRDAYVSKQFVQPVAAETQSVADARDIISVSESDSYSTAF